MNRLLALLPVLMCCTGCAALGDVGDFLTSPEGAEVMAYVAEKTAEVAANASTENWQGTAIGTAAGIGGTLEIVRRWRGNVNARKGKTV